MKESKTILIINHIETIMSKESLQLIKIVIQLINSDQDLDKILQ